MEGWREIVLITNPSNILPASSNTGAANIPTAGDGGAWCCTDRTLDHLERLHDELFAGLLI